MPVVAIEGHADQLHSLREWLSDVDVLRGSLDFSYGTPQPGRLGQQPALLVGVETEPQVLALAKTVEFWLRMRGSDVALKLRVGQRVTELDLRGEIDVDLVVRQVDTLLREALHAAKD
ncbi:hypothetical protein ACIBG8_01095 [Nonomuraea sp. NPDC050556]|uniref:effector-associated constant component EACC1 n=1 Tax=Nonomuraea sp. NPDC050556 TaxID=3364369 RepID=UPI0037BC199B